MTRLTIVLLLTLFVAAGCQNPWDKRQRRAPATQPGSPHTDPTTVTLK
jgi:hypothetical protein